MSDRVERTDRRSARDRSAWEWVLPAVIAIVLLGPALRPGLLFNLDLILTPRLDTPRGFWGLGPELPRRLELWVPISWLSSVVSAAFVGKLLMVVAFVVAWAGMARFTRRIGELADRAGVVAAQGAGALYAFSPFVLTRTAVGHFNVTLPHAVLPWTLPVLMRPGRRLPATFVASFALGFAGHFGGSVAVTVVVASIIVGHRKRWLAALAVTAAAQAPWAVPGLMVALTNSIDMADGNAFPTFAEGLLGLARLSAGGGFWNTYFQVGGSGVIVAACGAALLGLAVVGTRHIDTSYRSALLAIGIVGWAIPAATAIPVVEPIFVWVNDHLLGGIWREGHRMLTLHLVWLAPASALGARALARRCAASERWASLSGAALITPVAIAALLSLPGAWGLGGQLRSEDEPPGWSTVRETVESRPGTVVALPWYQYFNLSVSGGPVRRVLNPLPLYLGGDVIASSNNGLQADVREVGDPREPTVDAIVERVGEGEDPASAGAALLDLGVRWVVLLNTVHVEDYEALRTDPGLTIAHDDDDIALFEVDGWEARWSDGVDATWTSDVAVDWHGPALATFEGDGDAEVRLPAAGSGGWRRGWAATDADDDGLLVAPASDGPLWNVSTIPSLVAQAGAFIAVAVIGIVALRRRRCEAGDEPRNKGSTRS